MSGSRRVRILIVDDHPVMREGLVRVLEREAGLRVCAEAASIPEALAAITTAKPDLAIVDISLGGQNAIELIKDIKVRHPQLPLLVHSMHDEAVYAERSLRAGASGYVMKQEPPQQLLAAVRRVLDGEIYLSENMTRELVRRTAIGGRNEGASSLHQLSDREFEIFEMLGRGLQIKEIAGLLHLSAKTVHSHRERLKEKLQLRSSASVVRRAIQWAESQK